MSSALTPVRILLLEDDTNDADAIKENLESHGWIVEVVSDVEGFRKKLRESSFEIFVVDYDIPTDRDGRSMGGGDKALEMVRESVGVAPIILYSGVLEGEFREAAEADVIRKGASYILQKGAKGSALSALVERIVTERGSEIGFRLRSYFADRLGEKVFYFRVVSDSVEPDGKRSSTVEVQRLFDEKPLLYQVTLSKEGEVLSANPKT